MMNVEIFREYDIRGVVGKDFDANFARTLGRAYAGYLKKHGIPQPWTVTVGHDARLSSPELEEAMVEGLMQSGCKVLRLGLITTPISYFSTFTLKVSGGLMITGSHNPPDYNGFKVSVGKGTIFGQSIQELRQIMEKRAFVDGKGSSEKIDIFPTYVDKYRGSFHLPKKVKVVVDCGNGAAGVIAKRLYEACGVNAEYMFLEPDGRFPNHHPDPTVEENLVALKKRVLDTDAVCGIGFDGDADRIGVVDEKGRPLYGDELMVLLSRPVLAKNKGAVIIGDVKCSDRLYKDIEKHGGRPIMWKTGHSLIKDKMKEEKSPFSGEMSGHVFFADRNFGYDDALYAGLRVIEVLSESGKTISQLLSDLPPAYATPEIRIETTEEKKRRVVAEIKKLFGPDKYKINDIDGIRISYDDGFALVRSSNTQPVVVCRFEATSPERLKAIRDEVEGAVRRLL